MCKLAKLNGNAFRVISREDLLFICSPKQSNIYDNEHWSAQQQYRCLQKHMNWKRLQSSGNKTVRLQINTFSTNAQKDHSPKDFTV